LWPPDEYESENLYKVFVDKSFQIKFRVPPPVLSDEKDFFNAQIKEAFPDHHPELQFHTVYQLYRLKGRPKKRPITPRDMKLFINKVGALHRQWVDDIPLPLQALYVLYDEEVPDHKKDLKQDHFFDPHVLLLIEEPEWQKFLASLHFNVEPEKSLHVLMANDIEDALRLGNSWALSDLLQIRGSMGVTEQILEGNCAQWAIDEPSIIGTAAWVLDDVGGKLKQIENDEDWTQIWTLLHRGASGVKHWKGLNEEVGKGIVAILRHHTMSTLLYKELAERVLESLAQDPLESEEVEKPPKPLLIENWVKGVLPIISDIHEKGHADLIRSNFRVPGSAKTYVEAMFLLAKEPGAFELANYFNTEIPSEEIENQIGEICKTREFSEYHAQSIDMMLRIKEELRWQQFFTALKDGLQNEEVLNPTEIIGRVSLMVRLVQKQDDSSAKSDLQQLATNGYLMHHFHHAHSAKAPRAVAWCMLPIFEFNPEGDQSSTVGSASAGVSHYNAILNKPSDYAEIVNAFVGLVLEFGKIEVVFKNAKEKKKTEALVSAVIELIIKREDAHKQIPISSIIEHYRMLSRILPEDAQRELSRKSLGKREFLSELRKRGFSQDLAGLYLLAFEAVKDRKKAAYTNFLLEGLRSITKDVWLQELKGEGELLELALCLAENKIPPNLFTNFHDALLEHVRGIFAGQSPAEKFREKSSKVLDVLDKAWKQTFLRNLVHELLERAENPNYPVLELYGGIILESTVLEESEERAEEVVRRLFTGILGRTEPNELHWLLEAIKRKPGILKKCGEASGKTFRDRVGDTLRTDLTDEQREPLEEIARILGIKW